MNKFRIGLAICVLIAGLSFVKPAQAEIGDIVAYTNEAGTEVFSLDQDGLLTVQALEITDAVTISSDVTFVLGAGEAFTLTCTDIAAPMVMTNTMTTAAKVGCRALFNVKANVALGSYVNAVKGYMEFTGTSGSTTGLASGVCAELKTPNRTLPSGAYYPLEVEYVAGGTSVTSDGSGSRVGFIYMENSVDLAGDFDDNGFLMTVAGLTAGAGKILSAGSQTLRVQVGLRTAETTKYLVLSDTENCLVMSSTATYSIDLDTATGSTADIRLQEGATIMNTSANLLTITEPTITLACTTAVTATTPILNVQPASDGNAVINLKSDANAHLTVTQTNGAGVTFLSTSDGTAGFLFDGGIVTLDGAATLDNTTSASVLTITETTVDIVGAFTASTMAADTTIGGTVITASTGFVLGDGDYIGVTDNEIITFATGGTVTVTGANFVVGATSPDETEPYISIRSDADSDDAGDTMDEIKIFLTAAATPTNATWGFTSTQSAGYTFDKAVTVSAGLFTAAGGIDTVGATNDITLKNDATIVNTSADLLTVTEPTITLAASTKINLDGATDVTGILTVDTSGSPADGIVIAATTPTDGLEISSATGTHAINISAAQSGAGITIASTCGTYGLNIVGACSTSGIALGGASPYGMTIANNFTTAGIFFAAGGNQPPILVGAKSNTHSEALILVGATDDTGGVQIFCDDGNASLGSVTSPIWGRYLITTNQGASGPTATGMFAQIKSLTGLTYATGSYTAFKAYNQVGGTLILDGANTEVGIINAGITFEGDCTVTNGTLSGIDINVDDNAHTIGTSSALLVRKVSASTLGWTYGLNVADAGAVTGVYVGTCTTSISMGTPSSEFFTFVDDGTIANDTDTGDTTVALGYIKVKVGSAARYIWLREKIPSES